MEVTLGGRYGTIPFDPEVDEDVMLLALVPSSEESLALDDLVLPGKVESVRLPPTELSTSIGR